MCLMVKSFQSIKLAAQRLSIKLTGKKAALHNNINDVMSYCCSLVRTHTIPPLITLMALLFSFFSRMCLRAYACSFLRSFIPITLIQLVHFPAFIRTTFDEITSTNSTNIHTAKRNCNAYITQSNAMNKARLLPSRLLQFFSSFFHHILVISSFLFSTLVKKRDIQAIKENWWKFSNYIWSILHSHTHAIILEHNCCVVYMQHCGLPSFYLIRL